MTTLSAKTERTRLHRSVRMGIDQTERPAKPAFKTRNRAQIAHQMPEPWQTVPKRLDPCATQRQDGGEGIPLGECRLYGISVEGLEQLSRFCFEEAHSLSEVLKRKPRKGGKRRDAIIVASIIHDIFIATGRPISAQHVSGSPVTEFGKTVDYALNLWEIKADWRRASEAVVKGERVFYVNSFKNDANVDS